MFLAVAHTTDTPVWWLVVATATLTIVTAILAIAAIRALSAIREAHTDREVQVYVEFGRRWEGAEMSEAMILEEQYDASELLSLFQHGWRESARERVVLLRIPNYFEDAATVHELGTLNSTDFKRNYGGLAAEKWPLWEPTIRFFQEPDASAYEKFARLATTVEAEDEAAGVGPPAA